MLALEGIKVVEVAPIGIGAAPGAAMYPDGIGGADVIKIEPLWGDDARRVLSQPPVAGGESRAFLALNRNKRGPGSSGDIARPEGREIVYQLLDRADVFIHPQIQLNEMFATRVHPQAGSFHFPGLRSLPPPSGEG